MTDIVEWLRKEAELVALDRLDEAADEIERLRKQAAAFMAEITKLRAKNAGLRAALKAKP